jgi:hypothetical protein
MGGGMRDEQGPETYVCLICIIVQLMAEEPTR